MKIERDKKPRSVEKFLSTNGCNPGQSAKPIAYEQALGGFEVVQPQSQLHDCLCVNLTYARLGYAKNLTDLS